MREYRTISFNNEPVDVMIDYSDRDLGTMISFPMGESLKYVKTLKVGSLSS